MPLKKLIIQHLSTMDVDMLSLILDDNKTYQTNNKKIFAAGDVRRGQYLVVWAINEGRECAREVNNFMECTI